MPADQTIKALYAFIATEPDGSEGICSFQYGNTHLPMIGADQARIESLRPLARQIAEESALPVRLVVFTMRTEIGDVGAGA